MYCPLGKHSLSLPAKVGRYEVVAALAAGGMAEILLGRLVGPNGVESIVVIKRILPHLARLDSFVAMFLDEARIVSQIRHPNVVFVQELGQDKAELFLVMEYLAGESAGTLNRKLVMGARILDARLAAHLVAEACAGLHAAHELADSNGTKLGLVHRDVSPQNLFVTYDGHVKVLDFGVAKAADRIARTETGLLKGKFGYMAPEQCRGEEVDRRADIFALGAVLYEVSTGRRLFKRGSELATLKAIAEEPIVPPSRLVAGYPKCLEVVVTRALARKRSDRYETASAMRRDLLGAMREIEVTTGAEVEEPASALGRLMRELFAERCEAKREMLRDVRSGSDINDVPTDENDDVADVPTVLEGNGATQVDASFSLEAAPPRRRRTAVILALALSAALVGSATTVIVGGTSVISSQAGPASATPSPVLFEPPTAQLVASAPAPQASSTVIVHVGSQPSGASVVMDGKARGTTPLDLEVARNAILLDIELRRAGSATASQKVTPDRDQTLFIVLQPARPTRPSVGVRPVPAPPPSAPPSPFHRVD